MIYEVWKEENNKRVTEIQTISVSVTIFVKFGEAFALLFIAILSSFSLVSLFLSFRGFRHREERERKKERDRGTFVWSMGQERPDEEKQESRDLRFYGGLPPPLGSIRFSGFAGDTNPKQTIKRGKKKRMRGWQERSTAKTAIGVILILGFFFLLNWSMLCRLHEGRVWLRRGLSKNLNPNRFSSQVLDWHVSCLVFYLCL